MGSEDQNSYRDGEGKEEQKGDDAKDAASLASEEGLAKGG
jgi:hypothetical protein